MDKVLIHVSVIWYDGEFHRSKFKTRYSFTTVKGSTLVNDLLRVGKESLHPLPSLSSDEDPERFAIQIPLDASYVYQTSFLLSRESYLVRTKVTAHSL